MEAAKASVKKFMSKDGKHETEIHENVAPAVQQETVVAQQHEQQTTAVDKEVHQDHYHTTVQPVKHQEVLPEQHHHQTKAVEHRSFEHDNHEEVQRRLKEEQSQFRDTSTRVEGDKTAAAAPVVGGEHVHHHVHETIQPVVQKQTIEPHVVHTVVPVHEVHHNAAQHHGATALPPVSMDEFKKQGGALTGRETRHEKFDGCPPDHGERGVDGRCGHSSHREATTHSGGAAVPPGAPLGNESSRTARDLPNTNDSSRTARDLPNTNDSTITSQSKEYKGPFNSHKSDGVSGGIGNHSNTGSNTTGGHVHPTPASYGNDMHVKTQDTTSKPSLMDKLNPKVDSTGDGVAGFMK